MAAHILCHSNEILPNSYPSPRPSPKDHGMVSEYEPAIIMSRSHPQPNSDFCIELDNDITPELRKPTPTSTQRYDFSDFCDPALCLTPEKKSPSHTKHKKSKDAEGRIMKQRNSQRVRFDNYVKVKCMSPDSSPGQDSARHSPELLLDPVTDDVTESEQLDNTPVHSAVLDRTDSSEPIDVLAADVSNLPDSFRELESESNESSDPGAFICQDRPDHVLARPEFNSTLQIGKMVIDTEGAEIDVAKAVKERLKKSRKLKHVIIEKVTSKVNASSPQFEGLVSIEPSEDGLLTVTGKQKCVKIKPAIKTRKPEDNIVHAPDILEYLTPDLFYETASLTLNGIPPYDDGPKTADLSRAFDVYRHLRTWEGL